jgi:hypothetical protein
LIAKKAAPVKVAPLKIVAKKAPVKVSKSGVIPSKAIPYELAPALLDGTLPGDAGFDPCFLSTKSDLLADYFKRITGGSGPSDGLSWYRESELLHGRICMVAVVGFLWPGLFGTFAGNEWTGADAFSYTNALEAFSKAPSASLFQIFAFMSILEFRRINIILKDGASYRAGASQKWGQGGEGYWNPLGLNYTPEEYAEKEVQEIKHGRLAMIAFLGLVLQAKASGVGVIDQLAGAFVEPEYVAKAGYFIPEGI